MVSSSTQEHIEQLHRGQITAYQEQGRRALSEWADALQLPSPTDEHETAADYAQHCVFLARRQQPLWRVTKGFVQELHNQILQRAEAAFANEEEQAAGHEEGDDYEEGPEEDDDEEQENVEAERQDDEGTVDEDDGEDEQDGAMEEAEEAAMEEDHEEVRLFYIVLGNTSTSNSLFVYCICMKFCISHPTHC